MGMDYLSDYVDLVIDRITKRERLIKPLSYYKLAERLREIGIKITQNGLLNYRKEQTESMSWPVTAGLAELGGLSDKEVMAYIKRSLPKKTK